MSTTPPTHSVQSHLQVDVQEYDRSIRTLVPYYDEMMATGTALLASLTPATVHAVDLGAGTGRASEAILRSLPEATVELVDIDAAMLAVARRRLQGFGARARFRHASFLETLPAAGAVVASLSLHHVPEMATKTGVYTRIYACLPPGGTFLCFDATMSHDPELAALTMNAWAESMATHGIDEPTARGHFAAWAAEDHYMPLADELDALKAAGFPHPECFWRRGPVAIYGARKTRA